MKFRLVLLSAIALGAISVAGVVSAQNNDLPPLPPLPGMESPQAAPSQPAVYDSGSAPPSTMALPPMPNESATTQPDLPPLGLVNPAQLQQEADLEAGSELPPGGVEEKARGNQLTVKEDGLDLPDPEFPALPSLPEFTKVTEPGAKLSPTIGSSDEAAPAQAASDEPSLSLPPLPTADNSGETQTAPTETASDTQAMPELPPLPSADQPEQAAVQAEAPNLSWLSGDSQVQSLNQALPAPPEVIPDTQVAGSAQARKKLDAQIGPISRKPPSGKPLNHNFKTQHMEPDLYKREYSRYNRHLPKAVYAEDLEDDLFAVVARNQVSMVNSLLEAGVPVEMMNAEAETPLLHAVRYGADGAAKALLARGANPNTADMNGIRPIQFAAYLGRADMVGALLDAGADPSVSDPNGVTPLDIANYQQNIAMVDMLQSAGMHMQQASR